MRRFENITKEAYLVPKCDGGVRKSGVISQFDRFLCRPRDGAGAAHDLDRDLVVDKVAGHPAHEDASVDLVPVQSQISALDGEQCTALQRAGTRVNLNGNEA